MAVSRETGAQLLQSVAQRILTRYLGRGSAQGAEAVSGSLTFASRGIDITYSVGGQRRSVKVKADPYFGTDSAKIGDRSLAFYRADTGMAALEAVANSTTRQPGWMIESDADELCYYYLALAQPEDEVRALLGEPDEVFFSELQVERDDLIVIPMAEARLWFEANADSYPPRPVFLGTTSAWYRLVPRAVLQSQLPGVRIVGPVFASLTL
ncbi:MAG: hypothetical protein P4L93_05050 [Coriobacteriia bacterium]|nr:hypothetical protein [Coriobacteriia bacterium]